MFIEKVLTRHGGDVRLAAEQLGMSRRVEDVNLIVGHQHWYRTRLGHLF